jgi:hypothetical protein
MYVSTSQQVLRQHREEIMHAVAAARLPWSPRTNSMKASYPVWNLRWELSRYVGLMAKRLRKQSTES